MEAPATGESNLPQESSALLQTSNQFSSLNPSEVKLTLSQLLKPKTSLPPSNSSLGKRRKSKPVRYDLSQTTIKEKPSRSKLQIVVHDSSSMGLSSLEENSATKGLKSPAESSPAMLRAREVQSSLGTERPSCIKSILISNVSPGLWMNLPQPFCNLHLPKEEIMVVLEDQNGGKYDVTYTAYKSRISEGWRKFAVEHNLRKGDVLVFHLVEPYKFKVYIIRGNGRNNDDGALSVLNSEALVEQMTPEAATPSPKTKKRKYPRSLPLIEVQRKQKGSTLPSELVSPPQVNSHPIEHSGNNSEEVGSETLEGFRPSKQNLCFEEVKAFEDFSILVNGQCIDSELPVDVRMNYYKLCLANKGFLHDGIPESTYPKLVAGMIGETVSIANQMKNCNANTTKEEFEAWDNSLKSFQLLGMKVDFLRNGLKILVQLAFASEDRLHAKRCAAAKEELKSLEDEIKKAEEKVMALTERSRKLGILIDTLNEKAENYMNRLKQEVDGLW